MFTFYLPWTSFSFLQNLIWNLVALLWSVTVLTKVWASCQAVKLSTTREILGRTLTGQDIRLPVAVIDRLDKPIEASGVCQVPFY